MDDHAAILEWLHAHRPGEVPKDDIGRRLEFWPNIRSFRWVGAEAVGWECRPYNAHAHIELAAWRVVRKHCQMDGGGLLIDDSLFADHVGLMHAHHDRETSMVGSGPTDAAALLAALRWIGGQEGDK
jgi:hypothetical protein